MKLREKTRQNIENKQTFNLKGKRRNEIERKSRQNAENKQTFRIFQITHILDVDFNIPLKKIETIET